jgi:hypothetical protein
MNNITITRKLAIINGYVEIPNARIQAKTAVPTQEVLNTILGTSRQRLTESGGRSRDNMKFIKFPAFNIDDGYPSDWFSALNALV